MNYFGEFFRRFAQILKGTQLEGGEGAKAAFQILAKWKMKNEMKWKT